MEFSELVGQIAKILSDLKIKYCITGGYAVSVWGRPRSTFDIDLIIQLGGDKIEQLVWQIHGLSEAGYLDRAAVKNAVAHGREFNYIHGDSGIKIDFWVIKKSDSVGKEELSRRKLKEIGGRKIYFISPEDLILSKLRWHKDRASDRHLEDIKSVLKLARVDLKYLKRQAIKQGNMEILNKFLDV
ncbi:MAG: hypothetical protein UW11_C0018G0020 [Parcubacteria group bacterium GW2011_GWA2_43_9b]|uniref:DUF6036 domain-containing protein n=1 Tax=Candidatus Portnoybacteria bacterium RIFCSPLOWO2_02_FULL_39_11 TaxID=1802001 RepID=A0A1G2FV37_9BACT|nr:MAG: hypothetical protein UW11_C0018G0020 [Parcubacteria group bacterium GW2011_GWA2_43_9b]OGZ41468.1 MAG: hypothetical protein A3B04_03235 [Candidatus Portnoybacteria bacterium RIFCSPLOWO2_02_FULL_39_11]